jgi:hypothetical protein
VRRRRNGFAKTGIVCLVLLVALAFTGISYAAWLDKVNVLGTVNTGTRSAELSVTGCQPADDMDYVLSDYYVAEPPSPDRIEVIILNPEANGDYYCDFLIVNDGTIPVKIETIEIDYGNLPGGSTVDTDIEEGQQIDTGPGVAGTVHAQLPDTVDTSIDYTFTITFIVVHWNK